jgi:hypothetical protein
MHPHTVDWLRPVEINPDLALAQKRWETAAKYADALTREKVVCILDLFLFPNVSPSVGSEVTEEMLRIDGEFPVSGNTEKLRLLAGLVMAVAFERSDRFGDAFCLGLKAAQMNSVRGTPSVAGIAIEAESYRLRRIDADHPSDFALIAEHSNMLKEKYAQLCEAEAGADAAKKQIARSAYHAALVDERIPRMIRQLSEETQILWLTVSEFSPTLKLPTSSLKGSHYALVAASEISHRIFIFPPSNSIYPVLGRVLSRCKASQKSSTLRDFLATMEMDWLRTESESNKISDCRNLVPIATAIEKTAELGNADNAIAALPNLCKELPSNLVFNPTQAAQQYFAELSFLTVLNRC